jgi:hypothetical protein
VRMRRSVLLLLVTIAAGPLVWAQTPPLRFIRALCGEDATAAIIARALSDFASRQSWQQATATCQTVETAVAGVPPASPVLVLTSYSAIERLASLSVVNPHLIAYPTYLLATSADALNSPSLTVGYTAGLVDHSRLHSVLLGALGRSSIALERAGDSVALFKELQTGRFQAVVVFGDDPGGSLARALETSRQANVRPSLLLSQVEPQRLGQMRSATIGYSRFLFWSWAQRPIVSNVAVPTIGGNAILEIVRSISTESQEAKPRATFGGGSGPQYRDKDKEPVDRRKIATELDDLPVLLSSANAISVTVRDELGRLLSSAYLRAAYEAPKSGIDGCSKDYAESATAAYLLNAFLENQTDVSTSCVLWAHYALTGSTAKRRPNRLNADWLNSVQGEACELMAAQRPPNAVGQESCEPPPEKKFALGERAVYAHGIDVLRRGLESSTAERPRLLSEARACLLKAVKERPAPTCHDLQLRGPYEPYLPLVIAADGLQDQSRLPVRR